MSRPLQRFRETTKILLIAVFLGLLCLPTLDTFFNLDKAPDPNERREIAKFPTFKATSVGLKEYISGLEQYFDTHFGFRKRLIRWNTRWKKNWFNDSSLADVVIGRDGWYYFAGGRMIDHYRGKVLFTPEDLIAWEQLLEGRRDWLAERGVKYVFVVPPNKQSVYPEFLPEWLSRTDSQTTTKLDQLIEHLRANSTLDILDLRQPLIHQKQTGRLFMYTDSHWNHLGGFVGYQAIIKRLQKEFPDLEPLPLDQFETKVEDRPGGDLAGMMGQQNTLIERENITLVPRKSLQSFQTISLTNFLNKQWAPHAEPLLTRNPHATRKVIIFRDSFSINLMPFLGYHFNEIYYVWQYNWAKPFIEREKPDLVMDIMLEAYLQRTDPRDLKTLDESPESTMASHNQ